MLARAIELQWGHDFLVVEIFRETRNYVSRIMLQWGHDFLVVEIVASIRAVFSKTYKATFESLAHSF